MRTYIDIRKEGRINHDMERSRLIRRKAREIGCEPDELDVTSIDTGVLPEERNLEVYIEGTTTTFNLTIESHS